MSDRYKRAEPRNVSGLISDVLKNVGDKPVFIELHNLVEMLDVNLADKYFREAFNYKPTDGIATLIQYGAIHLYDFSKLIDESDTPQTESTGSPIGDYRDGVGVWKTDCEDRYAIRTDSGEVVAYACPLGCEQTDCPWE